MTTPRANKARCAKPLIVAVLSSPADLKRAMRLRRMPDFFELRLDALYPVLPEVEREIAKLRAPLIITARHPLEGGLNNLSTATRRKLLLRFLPRATYVDVELRSAAQLAAVLERAKARKIKRIISVHDLLRTPSSPRLQHLMRSARAFSPDIFKIAARTNTPEEWARLSSFFNAETNRTRTSAMGLGRFGRISRISFARRGSALNYVYLGSPHQDGQLSLSEIRRALAQ